MSRLDSTFQRLKDAGRTALIPYLMAGDPGLAATVPLMHALVAAGADAIELGLPFSDPTADGPVIASAGERSLAVGTTLAGVLDAVRGFRESDATTPVVLMGYLNPVLAMGVENFATRAAAAGVDGVLMVDLSVEEAPEVAPRFEAAGLDPIFLLAPTSPEARVRMVAAHARGYVYYVSVKGITGSAALDPQAVGERVRMLRDLLPVPVGVGFGIRDAESARRVGLVADAVIVGTVVVSAIAEGGGLPATVSRLRALIGPMRAALDAPAGQPALAVG